MNRKAYYNTPNEDYNLHSKKGFFVFFSFRKIIPVTIRTFLRPKIGRNSEAKTGVCEKCYKKQSNNEQ